MRKVRVLVEASKLSTGCKASSARDNASTTSGSIIFARSVGVIPELVLTNIGSPSKSRKRRSALLMAGWVMPSFSAALDTLRSFSKMFK